MSVFIVFCSIVAVLFWRSLIKIAAILAVILMAFGVVALLQGVHHVIR
jgi:hypothetical protein